MHKLIIGALLVIPLAACQDNSLLPTSPRPQRPSFLVSTCSPEDQSGCESGSVGGTYLPAQFTEAYCFGRSPALTASDDTDQDGLRDDCELLLAQTFRPLSRLHPNEGYAGREPKFSAKRQLMDANYEASVAIFYALSYRRDPGDPVYQYDAHDGDSEFVIVEVSNWGSSLWRTDYVTYSAHWRAPNDRTARVHWPGVDFFDGYRIRPIVWTSWDKHGNYPKDDVCNGYNWEAEFCGNANSHLDMEMSLSAADNLGNRYNSYPQAGSSIHDCYGSAVLPGLECYWTNGDFAGWHYRQGQATATGYGVMLQALGF